MIFPVVRQRLFSAGVLRGGMKYGRFYSSGVESVEVDLGDTAFKGHRVDVLPATKVELSKTDALKIYSDMLLVRRLEMAADSAYKSKMIRGFCHLCTGQEAVPVGIENALTKEDAVITAYRCHGFTFMRGGTAEEIMSELMGRKTGISKGKGGSMHMFTSNFYGGNGIVGAQVPVGAGIAFTQKYLGQQACTVALYGDGASNQGQVFEAFNMAQLWRLPVVFVCENNKYGMGTAASRAAANTAYYTRGDLIPGLLVDGMDVLAVREAVRFARAHAIRGDGPVLLELQTYRYGGHSMSDPGTTYRTREEIQHMRSTADPITGFKQLVTGLGLAKDDALKDIERAAKAAVDAAVTAAKASPEPHPSALWDDVYHPDAGVPYLRGRTADETHHY